MTYTVRNKLFKSIIYKQVSWFDSKDRAPGILSNNLCEDINALNGLTTEYFSVLLESATSLGGGIILSMIYTWKMGLITLAKLKLNKFSINK